MHAPKIEPRKRKPPTVQEIERCHVHRETPIRKNNPRSPFFPSGEKALPRIQPPQDHNGNAKPALYEEQRFRAAYLPAAFRLGEKESTVVPLQNAQAKLTFAEKPLPIQTKADNTGSLVLGVLITAGFLLSAVMVFVSVVDKKIMDSIKK